MTTPASGRAAAGTRQLLAVVAAPGTTEPVRGLVRRLASLVDVVSLDQLDRLDRVPDAVLATSAAACRRAPPDVPLAVWVADSEELADVAGAGRDVRVVVSDDREAIAAGAVALLPDALDIGASALVPPLVRARWRERLGLPADLIVVVGGGLVRSPADLVHAAAAVVSGPSLAIALASGTPTVTTTEEADRLGLHGGQDVEVPAGEAGSRPRALELAGAIAADDEWAARLSFAARRFAESHLDLGHIAEVVLHRCGIDLPTAAVSRPQALLDERLQELATPAPASIRRRGEAAAACFARSIPRS